jgi:hypothetical protein
LESLISSMRFPSDLEPINVVNECVFVCKEAPHRVTVRRSVIAFKPGNSVWVLGAGPVSATPTAPEE